MLLNTEGLPEDSTLACPLPPEHTLEQAEEGPLGRPPIPTVCLSIDPDKQRQSWKPLQGAIPASSWVAPLEAKHIHPTLGRDHSNDASSPTTMCLSLLVSVRCGCGGSA